MREIYSEFPGALTVFGMALVFTLCGNLETGAILVGLGWVCFEIVILRRSHG